MNIAIIIIVIIIIAVAIGIFYYIGSSNSGTSSNGTTSDSASSGATNGNSSGSTGTSSSSGTTSGSTDTSGSSSGSSGTSSGTTPGSTGTSGSNGTSSGTTSDTTSGSSGTSSGTTSGTSGSTDTPGSGGTSSGTSGSSGTSSGTSGSSGTSSGTSGSSGTSSGTSGSSGTSSGTSGSSGTSSGTSGSSGSSGTSSGSSGTSSGTSGSSGTSSGTSGSSGSSGTSSGSSGTSSGTSGSTGTSGSNGTTSGSNGTSSGSSGTSSGNTSGTSSGTSGSNGTTSGSSGNSSSSGSTDTSSSSGANSGTTAPEDPAVTPSTGTGVIVDKKAARTIYYANTVSGVSTGFLDSLSASTVFPVSYGIGSFYQPAGYSISDINSTLRTATAGTASVVAKTVSVSGNIGSPISIPSFSYPTSGDFSPLVTNYIIFIRPKNLLFDKILGSLIFQNISIFNSAGKDSSISFTPDTSINKFLTISDVGTYLPAFCKNRALTDYSGIVTDSTTSSGDTPGLIVKNTSGIQSFMSFFSSQVNSDVFALKSTTGVVVSTIMLEYALDNILSQLSTTSFSNGLGLLRFNLRSWINFCMANTVVCNINTENSTPRLLSYRTLGAMSLKESSTGIRSVTFFPLVESGLSQGVKLSSFSLAGVKPSCIDTYLVNNLSFTPSPLDPGTTDSTLTAAGVTIKEVSNPRAYNQGVLAPRFYKYVQKANVQILNSTSSTAASIMSNFVCIPSPAVSSTNNFIAGGVSIAPASGAYAILVKTVPVYYKIIKRSYKMVNSAPFPSGYLSINQGSFTTTTTNPLYDTAERFHNLEDAFYNITAVTSGVEYSILPNSGFSTNEPDYPPEPLTIVIYGGDLQEIATFPAKEFSDIRVYVMQK